MKRPLIEACVDSYASAMAASRAGADRLELCAHLVIGGTTPTHALFRQVQRDSGVPINVLIRPRFGDFLYTEPELEEMCEEIAAFRDLGANGVVIGALTPDGELDLAQMRRMMACAGQMEVTLHRAFDMTRDPFRALEDAVSLGCRTILSSGQAANAALGAPLLAKLNGQAAGRIDLMAGCGVKRTNIAGIAAQTFCLAARDLGIGTCILGIFDVDAAGRLLELEGLRPACLIAMGYPEQWKNGPGRKETEELLSFR